MWMPTGPLASRRPNLPNATQRCLREDEVVRIWTPVALMLRCICRFPRISLENDGRTTRPHNRMVDERLAAMRLNLLTKSDESSTSEAGLRSVLRDDRSAPDVDRSVNRG